MASYSKLERPIVCKMCGKETWFAKGSKLIYCPPCHVKVFLNTFCCHTKGRWAGKPFALQEWQSDVIERAFGTLKVDGLRKYRFIYVEVPKKNGKSELASGIALYGIVGDGEVGAEVYSAAGDRDQASLVYLPAQYMVQSNTKLDRRFKILTAKKRIIDHATNSFYQVLSSEVFTKHGLNPSTIIFDEIHAQPNRDLWDVLTEGTDVARDQQLIFIITTAGIAETTSVGYEIRRKAEKCLVDPEFDPQFLPIIYAADINPETGYKLQPRTDKEPNGYDWEDPDTLRRCNPSLVTESNPEGIVTMENLIKARDDAKKEPARLNNFLRFRCNIWTSQVTKYIPMNHWDACNDGEVNIGELKKRKCYGGLDLSTSEDLTAFVLVFPPVSGTNSKYKVIAKFYVPEENMHDRVKRDSVPYDRWIDAGYIIATPGNAIDLSFIRRDIIAAHKMFDIREIAYDPYRATESANILIEKHGINMVEHLQTWKYMSEPTKRLWEHVSGHMLSHGGNPVLRWNADNLAVKVDANENVRPMKDESAERIDGVVALIMALGRAIANVDPSSVYEKRGVLFL